MIKILGSLVIFLGGMLNTTFALAGVYRCIGEKGEVEFRDHPCSAFVEKQDFLPYTYRKTDKKIVVQKEKEVKKIQKKLIAEEKRQIRKEARQKKLQEKEAQRSKRNQERCVRNQEKAKLIEKKLQFGCKIRRCEALKQQLIHCEKMKRKYCSST